MSQCFLFTREKLDGLMKLVLMPGTTCIDMSMTSEVVDLLTFKGKANKHHCRTFIN